MQNPAHYHYEFLTLLIAHLNVQATWMLDVSTVTAEEKLGVDLGDVFLQSSLHE